WTIFTPQSVLYRRLFGENTAPNLLDWSRLNVPELGQIAQRAESAIRASVAGYEQEFRVIAEQRVIWLREVVTVSSVTSGEWRLVGVITDITAQREAQEARKISEAQVEQMLATAD